MSASSATAPTTASADRRPLASQLALQAVRIEHTVADFHRIRAGETHGGLDVELQVGWQLSPDNASQLRMHVLLDLVTKPSEQSKEKICTVQMRVALDYGVADSARLASLNNTDPELAAVLGTAVHNAWPFMRETIFTMTAKMGVPPVVLPSLRISGTKLQIGNGPEVEIGAPRPPK